MALLPVQLSLSLSPSLSMQLTLSIIMFLLSYRSIALHLPLSDAARAETFTKFNAGVDPALEGNAAPTPRMHWITAGAGADAFDDKMPVLHTRHLPVLSMNSAVSSNIEAHCKSVGKLSSVLKTEETRSSRGLLRDIVGITHIASNAGLDLLRRESSVVAKLFRESWSAPRAAENGEEEKSLEQLQNLALDNVPALGMWQITDDEEINFRTKALLLAAVSGAGSSPAAEELADDVLPRPQQDNFPRRKALQADISPPGMWQGNDDQSEVKSGKRSLLADISPPGIWTDAEVMDSRFQKRSLLADISPPGMWSDDADDTQDKYHKRRVLADISPPAMWQESDDQSSDIAQK